METRVVFENVIKELRKLPHFIVRKLNKWARDVEKLGIEEIRKVPGYHDEPLHGQSRVSVQFGFRRDLELSTLNMKTEI